MPLDDATWALVREAYCAKILTVRAILDQFGVTQKHLDTRRKAEGWPVRLGIAQRNAAARRAASPSLLEVELPLPTTRQARMRLILRLYKAIDLKLTQMEQHMENPPTQATSTDHERDTRALNSLVRTFDHVTELNADLIRPASKSADNSGSKRASAADPARGSASGNVPAATLASDPAGTERMRLDIAQRLELILQKQAPPPDAG
jgi:hypothetical protein